jgi:hypothetical protein
MNQNVPSRFQDPDIDKKFRYAYVMKPNHNYGVLKPLCQKIVFVVDGWGDNIDKIRKELEASLVDFDDQKDIIIPTGSSYINMIAGSIIQRKLAKKYPDKTISYMMGLWLNGSYVFWRFYSNPEMESYEIIQ